MTDHYKAERVVDLAAEVGEAPRWDAERERLLWVDITGKRVHVFDPVGSTDISHDVGDCVGAAVIREDRRYLLALGGSLAEWAPGGEPAAILTVESEDGRRFNDAACDSAGRLLVGSLSTIESGPGHGRLYSITNAGASLVRDQIGLPNGIDWSPDDRTMYFTDSLQQEVGLYDYDIENGRIGGQLGAIPIPRGLPDGHTVDADGNIWVAMWSAGEVGCFSPSGDLIASVSVPTPAVTSCAFGGADLSTLFITTMKTPAEADGSDPLAGALFACELPTVGRLPNRFRDHA